MINQANSCFPARTVECSRPLTAWLYSSVAGCSETLTKKAKGKKKEKKNEDNKNMQNIKVQKDVHVFIGFTVYAQLIYRLAT